jgi:hypothetical protein
MQESFVDAFNQIQDWEQAMILSSLQHLVSMLDAKMIKASPILSTEPIGEQTNPSAAKSTYDDPKSAGTSIEAEK